MRALSIAYKSSPSIAYAVTVSKNCLRYSSGSSPNSLRRIAKSTAETAFKRRPGFDARSRISGCDLIYLAKNSFEHRDERNASKRSRLYQPENDGVLYFVVCVVANSSKRFRSSGKRAFGSTT